MRSSRFLTPALAAMLLILAGVPAVNAQEQVDAEVTEVQPGEDSDAESAEATDAEAEPQGDDDNFIPTEKINVDSSVSFPVDI